jgi:PAS domain-containing protein
MARSTHDPVAQAQLRLHAEDRLSNGTAPPAGGGTVGADTLSLLYRLAGSPHSAGDALKLLHELQTHQVELDLQHGQMEATERNLAHDRARYKAFFDFAPVGYFIVDLEGRIVEGNLAGAQLLGVEQDSLAAHPVHHFLVPESRPAMVGLLKALGDGRASASCEVQCAGNGSGLSRLQVVADRAPGGESVLMIVSRCDGSTRA